MKHEKLWKSKYSKDFKKNIKIFTCTHSIIFIIFISFSPLHSAIPLNLTQRYKSSAFTQLWLKKVVRRKSHFLVVCFNSSCMRYFSLCFHYPLISYSFIIKKERFGEREQSALGDMSDFLDQLSCTMQRKSLEWRTSIVWLNGKLTLIKLRFKHLYDRSTQWTRHHRPNVHTIRKISHTTAMYRKCDWKWKSNQSIGPNSNSNEDKKRVEESAELHGGWQNHQNYLHHHHIDINSTCTNCSVFRLCEE